KIDLAQGVLEVEGSETFVKAIYADFKAHFVSDDFTAEDVNTALKPKRTRTRKSTRTQAKAKAGANKPDDTPAPEPVSPVDSKTIVEVDGVTDGKPIIEKPVYTLVESLNLGAANGRPSLVEFMDTKVPITNEERNLVFLHYLQHLLKLNSISIDHLYTCYKAAKIRVPLNIENSLQITANQRHWIKIAKNGTLTVTPAGKLYVENQLPKKIKN
ncbi:MAG: hypothetical protein KDI79_05930, partial [Anaerolineae bacterium]|nr:hypothetical protein [Anaerolineae bacterium]